MFGLVDCNNFYASCERVFNPALRGRPIVVLSNNDGCVIARSAEAKALGIEMGGPYFKIKDLLAKHNVAVFSSNYTLYGDMSSRVMQTLEQFTPELEVYSIDEAFLNLSGFENLPEYAATIKRTVYQWTRLPVGVGVAPTKTLAKIANHVAKRFKGYEGVCVLESEAEWGPILKKIEVQDIWGIGRQYANKLKSNGIHTAYEFSNLSDSWLRQNMSVVGLKTAHELRGVSCLPLELIANPKKGITVSRCFGRRITLHDELKEALISYVSRAGEKLRAANLVAKRMLIFMHTSPHSTDKFKDPYYAPQLSFALPYHTNTTPELIHYAAWALERIYKPGYRYMKCGVILTDLVTNGDQNHDMFDNRNNKQAAILMGAIDKLNNKMGQRTLFYAGSGIERPWAGLFSAKSKHFTTDWNSLMKIQAK